MCGINQQIFWMPNKTPASLFYAEWRPAKSVYLFCSDNPETLCDRNVQDTTQGVLWQHTVDNHAGAHRVFWWHVNHLDGDRKLALTIEAKNDLKVTNIRYTAGRTRGQDQKPTLALDMAACLLKGLPNKRDDIEITYTADPKANRKVIYSQDFYRSDPWTPNPCWGGRPKDSIHGGQFQFDVIPKVANGPKPEYILRTVFYPATGGDPLDVVAPPPDPFGDPGEPKPTPPADPHPRGSWPWSDIVNTWKFDYEVWNYSLPAIGWRLFGDTENKFFIPEFSADDTACPRENEIQHCAEKNDAVFGGVVHTLVRVVNYCVNEVDLTAIIMPRGGTLQAAYQWEEVHCTMLPIIPYTPKSEVRRVGPLRVDTKKHKGFDYVKVERIKLRVSQARCFYLRFAYAATSAAPAGFIILPTGQLT